MSSSTVPIPAMPNFSTSTLATFGERNAGRVGPRWMFFTPRYKSAKRTITAFCSYQAIRYIMEFEKTPEIKSITYMKKVKLLVERGKSG